MFLPAPICHRCLNQSRYRTPDPGSTEDKYVPRRPELPQRRSLRRRSRVHPTQRHSCRGLPSWDYRSTDPGTSCSRAWILVLVFQHENVAVDPPRSGLPDSSAIFSAARRSQAGTSTATPEACATIAPLALLSHTTMRTTLNRGIGYGLA